MLCGEGDEMPKKSKRDYAVPRHRADRPNVEEDANHKLGKRSGYSEVDGHILISPSHASVIDSLLDRFQSEKNASQEMLAILQAAWVERETATRASLRAWWQNLADDIGIDLKLGWQYLPQIGGIKRNPDGPVVVRSEEEK